MLRYPSLSIKDKNTRMSVTVSVIMINYNSSEFTELCVQSILTNTRESLSYDILIVDNNSALPDYRKLGKLSSNARVRIFRSNINLGFSGGNMFATNFSNSKYYFFLNNDCTLLNDCLSILLHFCESNPKAGICSPQLYDDTGHHVTSFGNFPDISSKILGTRMARLVRGDEYVDKKQLYTQPQKVEVVSGSQMFVRTEYFDKIGGLDLMYFLYCEEEDLALRMRSFGKDVYLVPEAKNRHFEGGSTEKSMSITKEYYISFNYFYTKHYGVLKAALMRIILFLKIAKKSFSDSTNLRLSLFVLFGAHPKHSLRHKQKIAKNSDY